MDQSPRFVQRFADKTSSQDRTSLFQQKPVTVWLTGLSGAGKSTIAFELERQLVNLDHACYVLDGDNVRHGLTSDLGFRPEDRHENIRRIAHVAQMMNDAGLIVISALISPTRDDRAMAREIIGQDRFMETWLSASLESCARRDPKGLYARARAGEIESFTGVSAPYEPPTAADLVVETDVLDVSASVNLIFEHLCDKCLMETDRLRLQKMAS
ncbi:adenylyl-sulfate kinase [Paraburkholderia sp. BL10I2N1]|uniref:adenylyl-sulfate kinase n=1 Tax=Paraburkholderia sp. BL10I2N1 TaxID=1938796 RepID=UPI0010607810|nr:adenylyl-sulfate kinase [Paraburkholderia sp. BL10I2N1]TDN67236.1 adenylylsulfate kinase [Paraburkholderia sp. BL10I2N1]